MHFEIDFLADCRWLGNQIETSICRTWREVRLRIRQWKSDGYQQVGKVRRVHHRIYWNKV